MSYFDMINQCDRNLDVIFWILNGILGVLTIVVNLITFTVFRSSRQLRENAVNVFLSSLAISDVVLALLVVPGYAVFCSGCSYALSADYCWVFRASKDFALSASLLNLLAITYDRYLAVLQPLRYNTKMSSKRVGVILFVVWSVPLVFALLRNVWRQHSTLEQQSVVVNQTHTNILLLVFVFIPVIVMTAVNLQILKAVRYQSARVQVWAQMSERNHQEPSLNVFVWRTLEFKQKLQRTKGTLSCITVIAVFIVCWLPRAYFQICSILRRSDLITPVVVKLTLFFLFLQSSVNPFIYSFYRSEFRRAARKLLKFSGGSVDSQVLSGRTN